MLAPARARTAHARPSVQEVERVRARLIILAAFVLAMPSAAAAPQFASDDLRVVGSATWDGDAAAFFTLPEPGGLSWEAEAARVDVVRESTPFTAVQSPLNPGIFLTQGWGDTTTEESTYEDAVLASTQVREEAALLLLGRGAKVTGLTTHALDLRPEADPAFYQTHPDVGAGSPGTNEIVGRLHGEFVNASFDGSVLEVRGTFELLLHGVDYSLTSGGERRDERTGEFETGRTAYVVEGNFSVHRLLLTDGVLRLRAADPVHVYSEQAVLDAEGRVRAAAAQGALLLDGVEVRPSEGGVLEGSGRASLAVAAAGGRLALSQEGVGTAGALVPGGPAPGPLAVATAALLVVAAVAAGAFVVRRLPREDDVEMALLAMEERRWSDALPRLTRALAKRPDDPLLLLDRAICLEHLGRLPEASKAYEATLRRAPRNAEAHYYYARTLAKLHERGASAVHLDEALALDPRLRELALREKAFTG